MSASVSPDTWLARIGRPVRRRVAVLLAIAALAGGVLREAASMQAWRRPVRAEFGRGLRQAVVQGMTASLFTAALVGLGMVSQALYWLGVAGQEGVAGRILVTVLIREIAPLLVGLLMLGRIGMVTVAELGELAATGQARALAAQGLDPFRLLVLPRTLALAAASFTHGVLFVATALLAGFVAARLLGAISFGLPEFLDRVLGAMTLADFVIFPAKLLVIGLLVGIVAALTGLAAREGEDPHALLPVAFLRGVLAVILATVALSLAA